MTLHSSCMVDSFVVGRKKSTVLLLSIVLTTLLLLSNIGIRSTVLVQAQKLHHVEPDSVLVLNLDSTGYIDHVFPVGQQQNDGIFMITGSPNRVHHVDSNNMVSSYLIDTNHFNLKTMGVTETCMGSILSDKTMNLVYSGETIGKSYIVQLSGGNFSKVVDLISLGAQSQVLNVISNQELQLLHLVIKRNNMLTLIRFDPSDNSLREQMFPFMTTSKMHYNPELGLLVGIGNSTSSYLLFLDPNSLKIEKSMELDPRGVFTIDSIVSSTQFKILQFIYSTPLGGTIINKYGYLPHSTDLRFIVSRSDPNYRRYKHCIVASSLVSTCLNDYRSVVRLELNNLKVEDQYYALDHSSDSLKFSFIQFDDENQQLFYVLPPYFDGSNYRISIYNYEKFLQ